MLCAEYLERCFSVRHDHSGAVQFPPIRLGQGVPNNDLDVMMFQ